MNSDKDDLVICLDRTLLNDKMREKVQKSLYFLGDINGIENDMQMKKIEKIGTYLRNNQIIEYGFCYVV